MQSSKVLDMLNENRIDELKEALRDEIFRESLLGKSDAKKRYTAMKRYLKTTSSARDILQKPCPVEFESKQYMAFCNSYSLALTTEGPGALEICEEPERYPNVSKLVRFYSKEEKLDLDKVIAEAKSKGYKFKKSETMNNKYLMHYDGAYFRIALLDSTYGIIADGNKVTAYHMTGARKPLTIQNDIGICVIMPVFINDDLDEDAVVIETD